MEDTKLGGMTRAVLTELECSVLTVLFSSDGNVFGAVAIGDDVTGTSAGSLGIAG